MLSSPTSLFRTLLLGAVLAPAAVIAQSDHVPLQTSATLRFGEILESALAQAPEAREAPVRRQQAEAYTAAARSWMAGRPSLAFNYYNDKGIDDAGQVESNYGVQMPLWRPGERSDSRRLANSYQEQLALWDEALTLDVAGRVRASLADIAEAEALLQIEREATATAEDLLRVTTAQFDAGAVARLDVMQSENLLLEQRKRQLSAEAALVDAELAYRLLTGLEVRPQQPHAETLSTQTEIADAHPLLRYLQGEVAIADGTIRQDEIAAKGNPQLLLGTRRERGDRFTPYTDTVNLSLTIPFGGRGYVASRTSAARRDKVDAEVQQLNTRRALVQALHEAEHELFIAGEALPLAGRQAELSAERRQLAQAAFAAGELTLVQVVPAIQEARAAARELVLLQLRRQRLVTEFNQVIGVLP